MAPTTFVQTFVKLGVVCKAKPGSLQVRMSLDPVIANFRGIGLEVGNVKAKSVPELDAPPLLEAVPYSTFVFRTNPAKGLLPSLLPVKVYRLV